MRNDCQPFFRDSRGQHVSQSGGRGFELHTALAVRVKALDLNQRPGRTVVGLLGQSCTTPRPAPKGESRQERLNRPKRSQRWAEALREAGRPPEKCQWIYIADGEADFYEPIQTCQQHTVDFIIRSYQDRRLAGEAGKLLQTLESAAIMGETTIELRSRPGQPARTTTAQIRAIKVDLDGPWRPGGWQPPLEGITAIEMREVKGAETPLRWFAIARMGGFLARKNDGMPGWQTFWRRWYRLMWMYEGVTTLMQHHPKCG